MIGYFFVELIKYNFFIEKCKLGFFLFNGFVKCFFCLSGIYVFGVMNINCVFCLVGIIIIFLVVEGWEECGSKY